MKLWWTILVAILAAMLVAACGDDDDDSAADDDAADDDTADDDAVDDDLVDDDSADDDTSDDDTVDDDTSDDDTVDDDTSDDDTVDDDTTDDDTDPGDAIEPSTGFLARQAEYLQYCFDNSLGRGDLHTQNCRLAMDATEFDEAAIDAACAKVNARQDTSDFTVASLLRLLYLYQEHPTLSAETKAQIEETLLGFKYWGDEPGPDDLCWWSENHQILFLSAELLVGQLFPHEVFSNNGMTGAEHMEHAIPRIHRWLNFRGRFGFSEWHSNVYFNEDMPALVNLVDFAEDEEIRTKAAMVLDEINFDFANNYYRGIFATAHGRTYPNRLLNGSTDSTGEAAWIMLGLGDRGSAGNFTATFLATSKNYWPPVILEDVAADALENHEHRQRDSINIDDGPDYGIGYTDPEDVIFWWGMTGYVAQKVVAGTFQTVEDYGMWDGYLWSSLRFLRPFVGSPLLPAVAGALSEMADGVALQSMSTYTYRTPYYQLSGAQDYLAGMWTAQIHFWQATIDETAFVFTTYPGGLDGDDMAGPWTGGWSPRLTMYHNVGVIQYDRVSIPLLEDLLFADYTHAYFRRAAFDEVVEGSGWTIGRKGDSYVALYSQNPTVWSGDNDYELIADGRSNVWIVELGSSAENGDFASWAAAIQAATVTIGDKIVYESPSLGEVEVGADGPLTVDGTAVDLGPYARWDNKYCTQEFGTNRTVIEFGTQRLDLNFETGQRRYWAD